MTGEGSGGDDSHQVATTASDDERGLRRRRRRAVLRSTISNGRRQNTCQCSTAINYTYVPVQHSVSDHFHLHDM